MTTVMANKKKKKGRPSLLDLQKRYLKQQQQQEQEELQRHLPKPNPSRRSSSSRGYPSIEAAASPAPDFIAGDDDDDDERKEKKHKLLLGFNSNSECFKPALSANHSVPFGSDSNVDDEDPEFASKRRKISHGSNQLSEKVLKATDNGINGLQVESGPTTPLPDKKLLVFILDRLQKKDTYGVFSDPVDPEELPDYHEIIENPMDFATVRKKLDRGDYTNLELFEKDVFLICSNAMEYNSPDTIYFRQAKSMQELAKKDFENLRQDSDDVEPPQPKNTRRGRPPGKKPKKLIDSSVENIGPESFSDTTLGSVGENTNGSGAYNLRKGPNYNKFHPADAVNGVFHGSLSGETCTNWLSDWENEFPASVLRSVIKYGKKHFAVDEYKRDTYRFPMASGHGPSSLAALAGEQMQLVEVDGIYLEHSYATSVARFAADLGPVVWKIALKKIESIFPVELKSSKNEGSLFLEKVFVNPAADDLTSRLNSNCGVMRPVPFQLPQNSFSQPCINGSNNGLVPYILPQMVMLRTPTLMGNSVPAEASAPSQIFGMASTSNTTISPVFVTGTDSNEVNLLASSLSDSGSLLAQGSGIGSFRAPELGCVGEASFQGLTRHHKQDSHPFSTDLNVRFGAQSSSSSVVQIGSPQLPDLALQLRMGR